MAKAKTLQTPLDAFMGRIALWPLESVGEFLLRLAAALMLVVIAAAAFVAFVLQPLNAHAGAQPTGENGIPSGALIEPESMAPYLTPIIVFALLGFFVLEAMKLTPAAAEGVRKALDKPAGRTAVRKASNRTPAKRGR